MRRRDTAAHAETGVARPWIIIATGSLDFRSGPAAWRWRLWGPIETRPDFWPVSHGLESGGGVSVIESIFRKNEN